MSHADIRTNLIVGILASIIASALIALTGKVGIAVSVAVLATLIAVLLAYLLRRVSATATPETAPPIAPLGITHVDAGPNEQVESMLDSASTSIDFWGVSANRTARSPSAQEAMKRVGRNGGTVRFLLLAPHSPHLERRASDENEDAASWKAEIGSTVTRLSALAERSNIDLEIRYFDAYPVWRIVTLNGTDMRINWFLRDKPGHHSPEMRLRETDGGLFRPLQREFNEAWEAGTSAVTK